MLNMFIDKQSKKQNEEYTKLLNLVGSLSNLFSDSSVPYLYYRVAENVFCKAFEADNLSRSDCSIDARKNQEGLGLKTFLENNGKTFQKIAEFNKSRDVYRKHEKNPEQLMKIISELRNKRLSTTRALHNVDNMIYHCVTRLERKMYIYEQPMDLIKVDKLKLKGAGKNSVKFTDGINEYNFNISKSTLLKRFVTKNPLEIKVNILDNPFDLLQKFMEENESILKPSGVSGLPSVFLPLYSMQGGKHVPQGSGLNGWNAGGRKRKEREVYIPVPIWIHEVFKGFFPGVDKPFNLHLPNKQVLNAKMCQTAKKGTKWGKAVMSNPNTALGEWLLDEVLKVKPGKLVTYRMLEEIGIDSVEITKIDDENYMIDFKDIGAYEEFEDHFG